MKQEIFKNKEEAIIKHLFKEENLVTSEYSRNDFLIHKNSITYIGEVKTRNFNHTQYNWILELDKAKALIDEAKKYKNSCILYVNYFLDNKLVIWNLIDILKNKKYKLEKKLMNKHSNPSFNKYNMKVDKKVLLLNIKDAFYIKDFII